MKYELFILKALLQNFWSEQEAFQAFCQRYLTYQALLEFALFKTTSASPYSVRTWSTDSITRH